MTRHGMTHDMAWHDMTERRLYSSQWEISACPSVCPSVSQCVWCFRVYLMGNIYLRLPRLPEKLSSLIFNGLRVFYVRGQKHNGNGVCPRQTRRQSIALSPGGSVTEPGTLMCERPDAECQSETPSATDLARLLGKRPEWFRNKV